MQNGIVMPVFQTLQTWAARFLFQNTAHYLEKIAKKRVPSRLQGVHIGAADPKADTVVDCQDMNRSLEFLCETVKSRIEKAE